MSPLQEQTTSRQYPSTGIAPSDASWVDLANLANTLVRTNSIPDGTKLWWDARTGRFPLLLISFRTGFASANSA